LSYAIKLTAKAREDMKRLYAYMLDRDEDSAQRALSVLTRAMAVLEEFPFSCRKVSGGNPRLRELVVPFGSAGYVVLFRIDGSETVTVAAVRHQREDDYH
jgi:plasmid stabilization system protein ParE